MNNELKNLRSELSKELKEKYKESEALQHKLNQINSDISVLNLQIQEITDTLTNLEKIKIRNIIRLNNTQDLKNVDPVIYKQVQAELKKGIK